MGTKVKKKNIDFPKFILILNGPSCAGKSSVTEYFHFHYKNIFVTKGDRIKWMVSDYDSSRHKELVLGFSYLLIKFAIENGLSVAHDWSVGEKDRKKLKRLAKKYGLVYLEANIECNFDAISLRFKERIEAAKKGARISLINPILMKERYDSYFKMKNAKLPTFDSSKYSPKQIAKKLISLIHKANYS